MILIDEPRWEWRGRLWAHLVSDESVDELHAFAQRVPLRYLSYQLDHYDIPDALCAAAVDLGAQRVDSRVLVRRLVASGLRVRDNSAKSWQMYDGAVPAEAGAWLAAAEPVEHDVLTRPGELVVFGREPQGEVTPAPAGGFVRETQDPWGRSAELVLPQR